MPQLRPCFQINSRRQEAIDTAMPACPWGPSLATLRSGEGVGESSSFEGLWGTTFVPAKLAPLLSNVDSSRHAISGEPSRSVLEEGMRRGDSNCSSCVGMHLPPSTDGRGSKRRSDRPGGFENLQIDPRREFRRGATKSFGRDPDLTSNRHECVLDDSARRLSHSALRLNV